MSLIRTAMSKVRAPQVLCYYVGTRSYSFQVSIVGSQVLGLLLMMFRVLQTVIGLTLSASIEQVMTLASISEREQQR